jgi:putative transposase
MFSKRDPKPGPAVIFITTPTRDHLPIFSMPELARHAILQLGRAAEQENVALAGYCLLPSSLYAILAFPGEYDLPGFMYNYKWLSSRAIFALEHGEFHERLFRKVKFKPWMNRFDQMQISTLEQLKTKLDYLHNEPVRRSLVSSPADWEFSSAGYWLLEKPGLIKVEKCISWIS